MEENENNILYSEKHGITFAGARHFDLVMRGQIDAIVGDNDLHETLGVLQQGFIDQQGKFLTREEAMSIARNADQEIDFEFGCGGSGTVLYSEGLY